MIASAKYREHTDPLFKKLDLLKFLDINKYLYSRFMFRCYRKNVPNWINNVLIPVHSIHNYNTRQTNHLYCSDIKTNLGMTKFSYRGPFIWNKILRNQISPDTSEYVFIKSVSKCIKDGKI